MTKTEKNIIKRVAQKVLRENGIKVMQKYMTLYEVGSYIVYDDVVDYDYIMLWDRKADRVWQMVRKYNPITNSLWTVSEYEE